MKNKFIFALVLLMLLSMGVFAGSIVYSTIILASVVNQVLASEWIPIASYTLLAIVVTITAYFTIRFIIQCRKVALPEIKGSDLLTMTVVIPAWRAPKMSQRMSLPT